MQSLEAIHIQNKTVFLRCDFNIPLVQGKASDTSRIDMTLPTIEFLKRHGAKIIIASHLGRPQGKVVEALRLNAIRDILQEKLEQPVWYNGTIISEELREAVQSSAPGSIFLLENIQFDPGECTNSRQYAQTLASLAEVYVNDAFGQAHRNYASIVGIPQHIPSFPGFLMEREVNALNDFMDNIVAPCVIVMGGVKIETKLPIITHLTQYADRFLFGGGLANTLLYATGKEVGISLTEKERAKEAKEILAFIAAQKKNYALPVDIRGKQGLSYIQKTIDEMSIDTGIFDIGSKTEAYYIKLIKEANTVIWNGPMGYLEDPKFIHGTKGILQAMANTKAATLLGGGDTLNALQQFNIDHDSFTHVSSGGGAMLQYLEGKSLPGIVALTRK